MAKKKISKKDLRVVEALLFASEKVLTQAKLNVCFDDGTAPALPSVVETLQKEYEKISLFFTALQRQASQRQPSQGTFANYVTPPPRPDLNTQNPEPSIDLEVSCPDDGTGARATIITSSER